MPSLAEAYRPYFPIGAAVDGRTIVTQEELLLSQVNSLVAENDMKWERIHPRAGDGGASYDFADADRIVEFARQHGMKVRGHTLIWHRQTPAWVFQGSGAVEVSRQELLERLRRHIEALLRRYQGKVYCWDVVNEALAEDGSWRADSPWQRIAGGDGDGDGIPDFIAAAFRTARAADPAAKLFYNDYNIESGRKQEGAFALAEALSRQGLIDGVGIQGHWSVAGPDGETVRRAVRRFASLGLTVQVTELDVSVFPGGDRSSPAQPPPGGMDLQAERYRDLFRVFREEADGGRLSGVTFWGIADDHTWLDDFPVKGRKDWPLLFDAAHRPKKAFQAVVSW